MTNKLNTHQWLSFRWDILDYCWINSVIDIFSDNIDNYPITLKETKEIESLSYEEFIEYFEIDESEFKDLNKDNVWEEPLMEIFKTLKFLLSHFNESREEIENLWINFKEFINSIINRLKQQVIEAGNSKRKLKNWTVVWLSKFSNEWFEFKAIPYYAFACTNVSLDQVKVKNIDWIELTLRQIDTLLWSKNNSWELFLPNSLWVSVCLTSHNEAWDIVFVSQERNNATTLSQNPFKFIASASWWIPYKLVQDWHRLHSAIKDEIQEELWLESANLLPDEVVNWFKNQIWWVIENKYNVINAKNVLLQALRYRISKELWVTDNKNMYSWTIWVALVMEEARRNPEIVFISHTDLSLEEIKESWAKSKDKDESLNIAWITIEQIEKDLELRRNWKSPIIDNHFYMSFLWYEIFINKKY